MMNQFEDTKVLFFSHNDGSGFAEMPIVTAEGFMPGDSAFDSFVSDFIEANDLTLESLNDDFLTEEEYRQVLINCGAIVPLPDEVEKKIMSALVNFNDENWMK